MVLFLETTLASLFGGKFYNDGGQDDKASVQESHTDISSQHPRPLSSALSGNSRKRSIKAKNGSPPELRVMGSEIDLEPGAGGPRRLLMAATIERWIAQLTSQFDYDELLIFFLTYRTYIDATDLCHLLICRFHWALEEPSTPHEVMVKQIVRVRTFVAMRYWLITFFPHRLPVEPGPLSFVCELDKHALERFYIGQVQGCQGE